MWPVLKSNTPESSNRLNMLLVVAPISFTLLTIGIYILHRTFLPIKIEITRSSSTYTYEVIPWVAIGGAISVILAALFSIWFGKKLNKDAENQTPKEGNPAQPNANPQNLVQ